MRAVMKITVAPVLLLLLATGSPAQPVEEAPAAIFETVMAPEMGTMDAGLPGALDAAAADPWYLSIDALILDRTIGSNQVLVTGTNTFAVLESSRFDFDHAAGPRFDLRRSFGDWSVEAVYFALFNQRANAFYSPVGVAFGSPIVGAGFNENYFATLNNAEFNVRRRLNDRLSILAGFRYLSLDEHLDGNFFTSVVGPTLSTHRINNDMYGGQIGGSWRCVQGPNGNTALDLGSKLALCANSEKMNATVSNALQGFLQTGANDTELSLIAEISIVGSLRVWDCLWLRGGYQMMWLDGIGVAPAQLATAIFAGPGSRVNGEACIFYHGAIAGAELRW